MLTRDEKAKIFSKIAWPLILAYAALIVGGFVWLITP